MLRNHLKRKAAKIKGPEQLYTDQTIPKTAAELAIHNKKQAEVRNWLKTSFATEENPYPKVLFLTGPTGSGKSTCVEVLCKELNIHLQEYEEEQLYNDKLELEEGGIPSLTRFLTESGVRLLPGKLRSVIILVTSLPNRAYNDANEFRSALTSTFEEVKIPIIFCLSCVDSSWHLNPTRLFSKQFIKDNGIDVIKFNPAAISFLRKACRHAVEKLQLPASTQRIETICEESNGDLRLALNMMQMNYVGSRAQFRNPLKTAEVFSGRANREDTFHMLGRILHAKRIQPNPEYVAHMSNRQKKLLPLPPPPKPVEFTERTDLEHDVNDIIRMSSMAGDKVVGFLHENEPHFCSIISNLRRVSDDFSYCDALYGDWEIRQKLPDEYLSQIAARSVMFHNFQAKKPEFRPVIGPVLHDLNKKIEQSKQELRQLDEVVDTQYMTLTGPFVSMMTAIFDPYEIRSYLTRPFFISWKYERDYALTQMETISRQVSQKKKRAIFLKNMLNKENEAKRQKADEVEDEEEEEEKFVIEDSDDDSFDEF